MFIYAGCYAGQVSRFKSVIIGTFTLGTIAGCIMLYTSATGGTFHQNVSLGGYYMLAWNWGCMPLIIAWVVANTGGQTKKSLAMAVFQGKCCASRLYDSVLMCHSWWGSG